MRTGMGGLKVCLSGGMIVFPVFHKLTIASLRTVTLHVERYGQDALVTQDFIKSNVIADFYIRVQPDVESVAAAARSLGEEAVSEESVRELIDAKLTGALRSVAANKTFINLHVNRQEFAEAVQLALVDELKNNGFTLDTVTIVNLYATPREELNQDDVFDAQGMRAIAEVVEKNRKEENDIRREKEVEIHNRDVDTRKRHLTLEQDQKFAEADQLRSVTEYEAEQKAEARRKQEDQRQVEETSVIMADEKIRTRDEERLQAVREAEIRKEKVVETANIEKLKAVETANIEKAKAVEAAEIAKQITIAEKEAEEAAANALKERALAEEEAARQDKITVEKTKEADRARQVVVIKAGEDADKKRIDIDIDKYTQVTEAIAEKESAVARAEGDKESQIARAKGDADSRIVVAQAAAEAAALEADAIVKLADANFEKGQKEAEARRLLVEAENAVSNERLIQDAVIQLVHEMPAIITAMMEPARHIQDFKIIKIDGLGAGGGAGEDGQPTTIAGDISKGILQLTAFAPIIRTMYDAMSGANGDGGMLGSLVDKLKTAFPGMDLSKILETVSEFAGAPLHGAGGEVMDTAAVSSVTKAASAAAPSAE